MEKCIMTIKIATRFRPFSHTSPTFCLIPKTALAAEICPAYIRIFDPSKTGSIYEHHLSFGPLKNFTVILELEKGYIEVSGFSKSDFIRYRIHANTIEFLKGS